MGSFFDDGGLTPHGFCLLWEPGLIWLHAGSDFVIGCAYFTIPLALIRLLHRRGGAALGKLFWLFAAFILACGATHFLAVLTLWEPAYWLEGTAKAVTAGLSVVTATMVWPILAGAERSEARYRMMAETATDVIIERDLSLRLTYITPSVRELTGYSADEVMRGAAGEFCHPDDRDLLNAAWRSVASGEERERVTYRANRRDGRMVWIEIALSLARDPHGGPRGIVGIARDVSERKRAEEELRASEARYRLLAENMTEAVSCLDLGLRATYASPSFQWLLGYSPEEALGAPADAIAHPDDAQLVRAALNSARSGLDVSGVRYRVRHKSGGYFWVEASARLMSDGSAIVWSVRDVSSRKQAEDDLIAANAKLEQLARIDGLTGLANRRRFDEALATEFRRCARDDLPLSLILLDIDHFKSFNDAYGHQAGDFCLQAIAGAAAGWARRPGDLAARYGGEELAIVLPNTRNQDAAILAENMAQSIRDLRISHAANSRGVATASFGVATIHPARRAADAIALVERADKLLYEAKANGRDAVMAEFGEGLHAAPVGLAR